MRSFPATHGPQVANNRLSNYVVSCIPQRNGSSVYGHVHTLTVKIPFNKMLTPYSWGHTFFLTETFLESISRNHEGSVSLALTSPSPTDTRGFVSLALTAC